MNETIYILLPVHNRREITGRFIRCLRDQSYPRYHLVLLDDGSTDGTADMVRGQIPALTVIAGNGNWWWAGALQAGYQWLRTRNPPVSDLILIINDDTEFDGHFLASAVSFLQERRKTFLLAQCYDKENKSLIDAGIHVNWTTFTFEQPSDDKPVNCLSTRGLFFRVDDFNAVGGFHPFLLPHYLADYEFTVRAHRKGMSLMTDPAIRVRLDASTTGYHFIETKKPFLRSVTSVFLRKSAINPLALSVFAALAAPWSRKFGCVLRVWTLMLSHGWALLMRKGPWNS